MQLRKRFILVLAPVVLAVRPLPAPPSCWVLPRLIASTPSGELSDRTMVNIDFLEPAHDDISFPVGLRDVDHFPPEVLADSNAAVLVASRLALSNCEHGVNHYCG